MHALQSLHFMVVIIIVGISLAFGHILQTVFVYISVKQNIRYCFNKINCKLHLTIAQIYEAMTINWM